MKEFDFMKDGTQKEVFVYANNDFEAGYKLAKIDMSLVIGTHNTKNELVSVEELKPIIFVGLARETKNAKRLAMAH